MGILDAIQRFARVPTLSEAGWGGTAGCRRYGGNQLFELYTRLPKQ
jgi:hypothetical protein